MPRSAIITIVVVIGSIFFWTGCKDQIVEPEASVPKFSEFTVDPSSLVFEPEDGIRDTTVLIQISGRILGDPDPKLSGFSVLDGEDILIQDEILLIKDANADGFIFSAGFSVTVSTTSITSYDLILYTYNATGKGERVLSDVSIQGFSTQAPELLSVSNPDSVLIPISGTREIRFEAKAVHPVGQNLMDGVFIYLIDTNSNRIPSDGSSFRLFDDGMKNIPSGKDDAIAADSVYTLILAINSGNSPDTYQVYWYPKDLAGLIGDTLKTELRIVEP